MGGLLKHEFSSFFLLFKIKPNDDKKTLLEYYLICSISLHKLNCGKNKNISIRYSSSIGHPLSCEKGKDLPGSCASGGHRLRTPECATWPSQLLLIPHSQLMVTLVHFSTPTYCSHTGLLFCTLQA